MSKRSRKMIKPPTRWVVTSPAHHNATSGYYYLWEDGPHAFSGSLGEITQYLMKHLKPQDQLLFKGFNSFKRNLDDVIEVKSKDFLENGLDVLDRTETD